MLEEQQGTNYKLNDELAAKEEQILRLKQALDQRKLGHQGALLQACDRHSCHFEDAKADLVLGVTAAKAVGAMTCSKLHVPYTDC